MTSNEKERTMKAKKETRHQTTTGDGKATKLTSAERARRRNERVTALADSIGEPGVRDATEIKLAYTADVIRYAYLTDKRNRPSSVTARTLGKRIEALLAHVPADEADSFRETLLAAKQASVG